MKWLPTACPPNLAEACGYPGNARHVALYWEPCGDEVVYEDGMATGTGNGHAFLAFRHHERVWPHLEDFHLGDSESEAPHWLLVDWELAQLSAGSRHEVYLFLLEQPRPPMKLVEVMLQYRMPSEEEIIRRIEEDRRQVREWMAPRVCHGKEDRSRMNE